MSGMESMSAIALKKADVSIFLRGAASLAARYIQVVSVEASLGSLEPS